MKQCIRFCSLQDWLHEVNKNWRLALGNHLLMYSPEVQLIRYVEDEVTSGFLRVNFPGAVIVTQLDLSPLAVRNCIGYDNDYDELGRLWLEPAGAYTASRLLSMLLKCNWEYFVLTYYREMERLKGNEDEQGVVHPVIFHTREVRSLAGFFRDEMNVLWGTQRTSSPAMVTGLLSTAILLLGMLERRMFYSTWVKARLEEEMETFHLDAVTSGDVPQGAQHPAK